MIDEARSQFQNCLQLSRQIRTSSIDFAETRRIPSFPFPQRGLHTELHVNVRGQGGPVVVLEVVSYDRAGFGWSEPPSHRLPALDAAEDDHGVSPTEINWG
jgi:hypothetical protein